MSKLFIVVGFFALWSLNSCISVSDITIDQMEPGSVEIPRQVRNIALVCRNFKFSNDTLQTYWSKNGELLKATKEENRELDSVAVSQSLEELKNRLLESGLFESVIVVPSTTVPHYTGDKIIPFSSQFVKRVCDATNCDAVISLEMISYFYLYDQADYQEGISDLASVKINAIWALYLSGNEGIYDRYTYSDQLRWDESAISGSKDQLAIPPRFQAVKTAGEIAATAYSNRLVPHWQEAGRRILSFSSENWLQARNLAAENKWEEAAEKWLDLMQSQKRKESIAAKYNYAVACEMIGNMEDAVLWVNMSFSEGKGGVVGKLAKEYSDYLKERQLKIRKLNNAEGSE